MESSSHHVRLTPWTRLVAVCAILVVGCLVALAVLAVASRGERIVSYPVRGSLDRLDLDLGDADVVIARGGRRAAVEVQRRESFAFGHGATSSRSAGWGSAPAGASTRSAPRRAARSSGGVAVSSLTNDR